MHFDALTLACVADELGRTIVGGRVQQVVLVDEYSVGLEIYVARERRYLLISAQPMRSISLLIIQKPFMSTKSYIRTPIASSP